MSTGDEAQVLSPPFKEGNKIAIARLRPDASHVGVSHIEADIALIWPYSNSSQRISLLLAEKDIRLRKLNGQVKVTFHGNCARRVAQTQLGIGDDVRLGLQGAQWSDTGEEVSTPGKKVGWDIHIRRHVRLEVKRATGQVTTVSFTGRSPSPPVVKSSVVEVDGPQTNGFIHIRKSLLPASHTSPARRNHTRVSSSSFVDASLDPFANDDGYIVGRGRKRTKFSRDSGSWQLVDDEEEIPQLDTSITATLVSQDLQQDEQNNTGEQNTDTAVINLPSAPGEIVSELQSSALALPLHTGPRPVQEEQQTPSLAPKDHITEAQPIEMAMQPPPIPPFVTPQRQLPGLGWIDTHSVPVPTPILHPLASPGLALVSPLAGRSGFTTEYLPFVSGTQSDLDAISYAPFAGPLADTSNDQVLSDAEAVEITSEFVSDNVGDGDVLNANRFTISETEDAEGSLRIAPAMEGGISIPSSHTQPELVADQNNIVSQIDTVDQTIAAAGEVDLDALQQEIEATSHHLQAPVEEQMEDEDMYGPHSGSDPKAEQETEMVYPTLNSSVLPTLAMEPSQLETGVLPQVEMFNESLTLNADSILLEKQNLEQATTIDLSSDETGDEMDEETKTESESEDEMASETTDLEEELERELGVDSEVDSDLDQRNDAESLDTDESDHTPTPVRDKNALNSTEPPSDPSDNRILQSDGVHDHYENEDQRRQLRAVSNEATEPLLPVPTLEVTSRRESSRLSDGPDITATGHNDMAELRASDRTTVYSEAAEPPPALFGHEQDTHSDNTILPMVEYSSTIEQNVVPQHFQSDKGHFITPDATQVTEISKDSVSKGGVLPPALPLSPKLTQESSILVPGDFPIETYPSQDNQVDRSEPVLPELIKADGTPVSRASQRLSRKHLTSEKISTEYFTPRRSSRIVQPSPTFAPDRAQGTKQLTSPVRSKRTLKSVSPLTSPRLSETATTLPKVVQSTTTTLSYFPRLCTLHEHFNFTVDILALCTADSLPPQKAKSGPKDYYTVLCLADPSVADANTTVRAEIFRPREDALPVTRRGSGILLRNMKVQTYRNKVMLLSTASSAWAVFKQDSGETTGVTINGPPVEYNEGETAVIGQLFDWWCIEGADRYPDSPAAVDRTDEARDARSTSPMITRSQRRKLNVTDHDSNGFEQGQQRTSGQSNVTSSVADGIVSSESQGPTSPTAGNTVSARQKRHTRTPSSPTVAVRPRGHRRGDSERSASIIHELRDGTTYVDDGDRPRGASIIHELRDGNTYVDE